MLTWLHAPDAMSWLVPEEDIAVFPAGEGWAFYDGLYYFKSAPFETPSEAREAAATFRRRMNSGWHITDVRIPGAAVTVCKPRNFAKRLKQLY